MNTNLFFNNLKGNVPDLIIYDAGTEYYSIEEGSRRLSHTGTITYTETGSYVELYVGLVAATNRNGVLVLSTSNAIDLNKYNHLMYEVDLQKIANNNTGINVRVGGTKTDEVGDRTNFYFDSTSIDPAESKILDVDISSINTSEYLKILASISADSDPGVTYYVNVKVKKIYLTA